MNDDIGQLTVVDIRRYATNMQEMIDSNNDPYWKGFYTGKRDAFNNIADTLESCGFTK